MKKIILSLIIATTALVITSGCSGGGGETPSSTTSTTVTAVDGYIKDANMTDNVGQVGVYSSNGKYTFANSITYPLHLSGGKLEDTNASFDINMTAQSGSIISPITTFLENNASLQTKLAIALSLSDSINSFAVDYVDTNNSQLAKLSQLLYAIHKDANLTRTFKTSLAAGSAASLNDVFTLAEKDVNATMSAKYAPQYRAFLTKVNSLTSSVSDYETEIAVQKSEVGYFSHNGTIYGTVTSPFTGRIWIDRNLGASRVATAFDDNQSYGDYYQWGRAADGHEKSNSATTTTIATATTAAGNSFITNSTSPYDWTSADSGGVLRTAEWSKTDGTSVCPVGYRVPTITEIEAETTGASTAVAKKVDAYDNFLKLPSSGYRYNSDGSMSNQGSSGVFWSSSVGSTYSNSLDFGAASAYSNNNSRANGFPVRCVKD